jgi:predicted SAM-dependent methyltransferase
LTEEPRVVEQGRMSIDSYLRFLSAQDRLHARGRTLTPRDVFRLVVPNRYRVPIRIRVTGALAPLMRVRSKSILKRSPLRLNLGSARVKKPGWVSIDLVGSGADLAWNLATPLPFPDGSIDAILHEHLLEHLTLADGLRLLIDNHRLLKPDGVLRIGVPDAGRYLRSYTGDTEFVDATRPGRPTPLLAIQEVFYRDGHLTMYDEPTLRVLCSAAGFVETRGAAYGHSVLEPCPDSENRREETLYVEATR